MRAASFCYLRAAVAGASSGFFLTVALLPETVLLTQICNILSLSTGAAMVINNLKIPKSNLLTTTYLGASSLFIASLYIASRGNYVLMLECAGLQTFLSNVYFSRHELSPPPGEGKLQKAWQTVKSVFSPSVYVPAPTQAL